MLVLSSCIQVQNHMNNNNNCKNIPANLYLTNEYYNLNKVTCVHCIDTLYSPTVFKDYTLKIINKMYDDHDYIRDVKIGINSRYNYHLNCEYENFIFNHINNNNLVIFTYTSPYEEDLQQVVIKAYVETDQGIWFTAYDYCSANSERTFQFHQYNEESGFVPIQLFAPLRIQINNKSLNE